MKLKIKIFALFAAAGVAFSAAGQDENRDIIPAGKEVVYIKGVRFTDALLSRWISEYGRENPGISFSITEDEGDGNTVRIVPYNAALEDDNLAAEGRRVAFGRYAVLPVAGEKSTVIDALGKKRLNGKRLRDLFFEKDILSGNDGGDKKDRIEATVYSGSGDYSVSNVFASHFGFEAKNLRGKRIAGDDIYLNHAVKKDAGGVSFNSLNYVFNIDSREINEGIALLPLDIKKEYEERFYGNNLDEVIGLLESRNIDIIPVNSLVFVLPDNAGAATVRFVEWALKRGQDYINAFGFLRLDTKAVAHEQRKISELGTKLLASKHDFY
jgi:ABC-type phosphate transport system substrate-binding protein